LKQPIIVPPPAPPTGAWRSTVRPSASTSGAAAGLPRREDDEAWHVLEGELHFRFSDRTEVAPAGSTVFVPAGVAHTYEALPGARYLIILTPRLRALIAALQSTPPADHSGVYRRHASELIE